MGLVSVLTDDVICYFRLNGRLDLSQTNGGIEMSTTPTDGAGFQAIVPIHRAETTRIACPLHS